MVTFRLFQFFYTHFKRALFAVMGKKPHLLVKLRKNKMKKNSMPIPHNIVSANIKVLAENTNEKDK
jgi:hypothetical protein